MKTRYLVRRGDVPAYRPANHTGTLNRRLVGPGVTDGASVEVVHGTIQPNGGALPHAHEDMEQVCYLLSGRAAVTVGDETFEMFAGDCCYFPAGTPHSFTATGSAPAEVLVIYSPPDAGPGNATDEESRV